MTDNRELDLYELMQLSPNADGDTIHRVYRVLAQRLHPDNRETGNAAEFRVEEATTEQLVAAITGASDNVVAARTARAKAGATPAASTAPAEATSDGEGDPA